jgi:ribosomal protein L40E
MGEVKLKRPQGLALIAIFWFLFGIINVYLSFQTISTDLGVLPYLSDPSVHAWFSFGVPAELVLAILVLCLGLLQIVTVPGLWTGKPYSYKLALIVPVLLLIFNVSSVGLYASAPAELNLGLNVGTYVFPLIMSMVWVVIYWQYLGKPHVKAFLGITQSQSIIQDKTAISKNEEIPANEAKFYCRYCGAENKSDAAFCEKCGKQLRET